MTDKKAAGAGYSYISAIIGAVMLIFGSLDFELKVTNGKLDFRLGQKEIPTSVLAFAGGLISVGLGLRFTIPGLVGALLPQASSVEDLGTRIQGSKHARSEDESDQPPPT